MDSISGLILRNVVWAILVGFISCQAPESMPLDLTAIPVVGDPTSVTLSWKPPTKPNGRITGYLIFYTTKPSQHVHHWIVEGVLEDRLSTTISDLAQYTQYYFRLQARNIYGYGPMTESTVYKTSGGTTSCFKKFRRKSNTCGGLYKRKSFVSPDDCCARQGYGFTLDTPNMLSKNKYPCISCEDWTTGPTTPSTELKEDFRCFRKFRSKQLTCGGPLKKNAPTSPAECCSGQGNGFYRYGLNKKRKNQYKCMSCEEWRRQNSSVTTEAVTTPKPTTTSTTTGWVPINEEYEKGKNQYKCMSCEERRRQNSSVITEAVTTPKTTTTSTTTVKPAPAWWSPWGDCSSSCGLGTRTRYLVCATCDRSHHSNVEVQPCVINYHCPIDGDWSEWSTWEHCSLSCNGGYRRRERTCDAPRPKDGGRECVGADMEEETCNSQACPVDGHWGQWSRFGRCSATCGLGTMVRKRECSSPSPRHGGRTCHGPKTNGRRCEQRKCPVHGGWSSWGMWSACPVACGRGTRTRSRECNRPTPFFGGRPCAGSATEESTCEAATPCPVDGGWSRWTSYGRCRGPPCKPGHKLRSRVCNRPRPQHGGQLCRGRAVERITCVNTEQCSSGPGLTSQQVDGGWCKFTAWSECSATCRTFSAVETRTRDCKCPDPKNGGRPCTGEATEYRDCKGTKPCELPSVDVDER